jgi:DNA-binding NarL/FixJ family response regulator
MDNKLVKKIFVVDDDEMFSSALEDYITRKTKHKVYLFKTGEECLEELHTAPDVIILDYNLNTVYKNAANGLQILEEIKKQDRNIRVIMLSSQEAYGTAMQTLRKGAEEYVIKDEAAFDKIVAICNE